MNFGSEFVYVTRDGSDSEEEVVIPAMGRRKGRGRLQLSDSEGDEEDLQVRAILFSLLHPIINI